MKITDATGVARRCGNTTWAASANVEKGRKLVQDHDNTRAKRALESAATEVIDEQRLKKRLDSVAKTVRCGFYAVGVMLCVKGWFFRLVTRFMPARACDPLPACMYRALAPWCLLGPCAPHHLPTDAVRSSRRWPCVQRVTEVCACACVYACQRNRQRPVEASWRLAH